MRYLVIPDIHGHYDELVDLYSRCVDAGFDPERDTLVTLGDYVDGGSQSYEVLEWLYEMKQAYYHFIYLRGNHEEMMKNALDHGRTWENVWNTWYWQGGMATHESFRGDEEMMKAWIRWFSQFPLYLETENHIFVHAGLRPNLPLAAQREEDMLWIRNEFIHSAYDWGKRVVYGHTYTEHPNIQRNKIGLDTKYFEKGYLSAALIDDANQDNVILIRTEGT